MLRLVVVALVTGCAVPHRGPSLTASREVCRAARPFCLPARDMELLLRDAPLLLRAAEPLDRGRARSRRLLIEIPPLVRVKWKTAAPGGDGYNRSPRHELAAYAVQKLFLDEEDYVVPPTTARCQPPGWAGGETVPTFAGVRCVLGVISYWVEDAHQLARFDARRFAGDAVYRRRAAVLNVVTHLIDHRDIKSENFIATADGRPYSVDNGMAFSGWRTPSGWFVHGWQDLIVDRLPRDVVARLRKVERRDLAMLATVAEFRVRDGRLEPVPPQPPIDPDRGVRRRGDRIQLGLTRDEIDGVAERLQALLERDLKTF
jgi:hypothetical protein